MLLNNYRFMKLWCLSVLIYFLLFAFVSDLYFKSPILHGLTTHNGTPFAKRVVLIVADGLRQETLVRHKLVTPYLTQLHDGNSARGIVHTKVPTESRPGHAALLGGIYEDPSAVFSGWKKNMVEFDTVVNQSNYVWSFGSPDIVEAYTKQDSSKLHVDSYSPLYQDFSGKGNTSALDKWVFDKVKAVLHNKFGSCEESFFKLRRFQRMINFENYKSYIDEKCEGLDGLVGKPYCYLQNKILEPVSELNFLKGRIMDLKKSCSSENIRNCDGILCESGNFIFLHLLGMDSAGHIHKPNTAQFLQTLKELDKGVEEIVMLFEDFFNDGETAYIFTADHGMTDWGSHGDGSNMETEVPFIMWGKGIKESKDDYHLQQADISPFISILLGVPIPTNSVGFIEHRILKASKKKINRALLTNLAQLSEYYKYLRNGYNRDYFFRDFNYFKHHKLDELIQGFYKETDDNVSLDKNVLLIKDTANEVLKGIKYLNDYYFTPKMVAVWYGFIMWTLYLVISLHQSTEQISDDWTRFFYKGRTIFYSTIMILALSVTGYAICLECSYFSYLYIIFPTLITISFCTNKRVVFDLYQFHRMQGKKTVILLTVIITSLVQLLVLGFFYKYIYGLVMIILVIWVTTFEHVNRILKCLWLITNLGLIGCLLIPHDTSFNYNKFYIGVILWLLYYLTTLYIIKVNLPRKMKLTVYFSALPLILSIVAIVNVQIVAAQFQDDGVLEEPQITSWIITGVSIISIVFCSNNILVRFNYICAALAVPFILMSVNYDIITYTILIVWLNLWIVIENQVNPKRSNIFSEEYSTGSHQNEHPVNYDNHRRSFFYIAITICYFFAIGNMASFSGFDPLWSRAFVSTFRPFLMASLIMLKMVIPFFQITCAYLAINTIQKTNVMGIFTIVMLQLNQMVLNFMLNVKNEGSWKEIGQSLSHFIVMEVMAIVLLTFYIISKYVAGFNLSFTIFSNKQEKYLTKIY